MEYFASCWCLFVGAFVFVFIPSAHALANYPYLNWSQNLWFIRNTCIPSHSYIKSACRTADHAPENDIVGGGGWGAVSEGLLCGRKCLADERAQTRITKVVRKQQEVTQQPPFTTAVNRKASPLTHYVCTRSPKTQLRI